MSTETKVISVAEMRAADAYTIGKGTPGKELMLRAAQGVYDAFAEGWQGWNARSSLNKPSGNNL